MWNFRRGDKAAHLDTATANRNGPLSPALSPSEGEREMVAVSSISSAVRAWKRAVTSPSPREERVGRGPGRGAIFSLSHGPVLLGRHAREKAGPVARRLTDPSGGSLRIGKRRR